MSHRSAEWLRGRLSVTSELLENDYPIRSATRVTLLATMANDQRLLAEAEAREAGEGISQSLLGRLRQDLPAIRYHLGGIGPKIKLALDDSSRQSNILVALHALDALIPLLSQPREAGVPTAAEVIAACETAITELCQLGDNQGEVFDYQIDSRTEHAKAVITKWKEAHNA